MDWADYYLAFAEEHRTQPAIIDGEMDNLMAVMEILPHARAGGCTYAAPSRRCSLLAGQCAYTHAPRGAGGRSSHLDLSDRHFTRLVCFGFACCEQND